MSTDFHSPLSRAMTHALEHLDGLDSSSVGATASLSQLRTALTKPLPENGIAADQVIDELVSDSAGGILGSASGRFFGWVIGGSIPAALAADWLTSAWDQNAASYATGPAEAVIEEVVAGWLKELLNIPQTATVAFTTGSQMAHMTGLAAARHALLSRRGWDVERSGLAGSPPIRILTSIEHHGSIDRAIRFLGLGLDCLVQLSTDSQGRMIPADLEHAFATGPDQPTIVALQAGDLNTGAFDPFPEAIEFAHRHNAWVHVDGAFGLWAAASHDHRHLMEGAEGADSWVTDGHKWLNVPYDSGFAFVADPDAHRGSMTYTSSYLQRVGDAREPKDFNPEWSRRGRGVTVYAAIRALGKTGIAEMIDRCCQHASTLVAGMGALPNAEVVWTPTLNQGLVRFSDPDPGATPEDNDRWNDDMIAAIVKSGEAFFGGVTWEGRRVMRVSVCNWQTREEDVARTIAAVTQAQATLEKETRTKPRA